MMYWQDQLERLRREQNPGKYPSPDERPALHLPVPQPPLEPLPERTEDDKPKRGVIVIDL